MDKKYRAIIEGIWQTGKEKILEDGSLQMTYFIFANDNIEILVVPEFIIENTRAKAIVGAAIAEVAAKLQAEFVVVMSEAWVLNVDGKDLDQYEKENIQPSQHKDRIEKLILTGRTAAGEDIMITGKIIRDQKNHMLAGVLDDHSQYMKDKSTKSILVPEWQLNS